MAYAQILAAGAVTVAWWAGVSTETIAALTGAIALLVLLGRDRRR